jgi:sarcosine oxidase gamma subunit
MSRLGFLSPDECSADVVLDRSVLGKLEIRGDVGAVELGEGEELLPLGPGRALLLTDRPTAAARERLAASGFRVYDMTAALTTLEFAGEDLLRRLTELDPEQLPAVGSIARGTPAVIERREGERFRLQVPRELGDYVAEVIADLARGLDR